MAASDGLPQRYPELAHNDPNFGPTQNKAYVEEPKRFKNVEFDPSGAKILVVGNSFARDFINMGLATGRWSDASISYSEVREAEICEPLSGEAIDRAQQADKVFWATNLKPGQIECIEKRIAELEGAARGRVWIIGTKGFGYSNDSLMRIDSPARYSARARPSEVVDLAERQAKEAFGNKYISLLDKIKSSDGTVPLFTPQKQFVSQDTIHLTKAGASYIGGIYFSDERLSPKSREKGHSSLEVWDLFENQPDGRPQRLKSRQTYLLNGTHSSSVGVSAGRLNAVSSKGRVATYVQAPLRGAGERIGARFSFQDGTTDGGNATIGFWASPMDDDVKTLPSDSPCHFTVARNLWSFSAFVDGKKLTLGHGKWALSPGVEYTAEVRLDRRASTAELSVTAASGKQLLSKTLSNPVIGRIQGKFAFIEHFRAQPSDSLPSFREWWADSH